MLNYKSVYFSYLRKIHPKNLALNKSLLRHRAKPKFKLKPKGLTKLRQTLSGTIDMTRTGSAYVVTEEHEEDVYIPAKRMNGALHGDTVKVKAFYPKNRSKPEGEVIQVLEICA